MHAGRATIATRTAPFLGLCWGLHDDCNPLNQIISTAITQANSLHFVQYDSPNDPGRNVAKQAYHGRGQIDRGKECLATPPPIPR